MAGNGMMYYQHSLLEQSSSLDITPQQQFGNFFNMETVWNGNFYKVFSMLPHRWYLTPTLRPVEDSDWIVFQDSAKVRFICNSCGRAWTSMKGRCTFWYKLHFEAGAGVVLFKLYGQRCQHCNLDEKFEHAMWYPREVIKVISNIFLKVGETYYNFTNTQLRVDRRAGKPQQRHNRDLCQACHDGICNNDFRDSQIC